MRSNALKKEDFFEEITVTAKSAPKAVVPSWEGRRRAIALATEAACNLPGNDRTPDFEDFLHASDFA